jgi:hypothetical protein
MPATLEGLDPAKEAHTLYVMALSLVDGVEETPEVKAAPRWLRAKLLEEVRAVFDEAQLCLELEVQLRGILPVFETDGAPKLGATR